MNILRNFARKVHQTKALWIIAVALLVLLDICYGPKGFNLIFYSWVVCGLAFLGLAKCFPYWSWQHGPAFMQKAAVPVLAAYVEIGMTFPQVLSILGRGSADWPTVQLRKLQPEDTVNFRARSEPNCGIDVLFREGKVIAVIVT